MYVWNVWCSFYSALEIIYSIHLYYVLCVYYISKRKYKRIYQQISILTISHTFLFSSMSEDQPKSCCPRLFERAGSSWWNPRYKKNAYHICKNVSKLSRMQRKPFIIWIQPINLKSSDTFHKSFIETWYSTFDNLTWPEGSLSQSSLQSSLHPSLIDK